MQAEDDLQQSDMGATTHGEGKGVGLAGACDRAAATWALVGGSDPGALEGELSRVTHSPCCSWPEMWSHMSLQLSNLQIK